MVHNFRNIVKKEVDFYSSLSLSETPCISFIWLLNILTNTLS